MLEEKKHNLANLGSKVLRVNQQIAQIPRKQYNFRKNRHQPAKSDFNKFEQTVNILLSQTSVVQNIQFQLLTEKYQLDPLSRSIKLPKIDVKVRKDGRTSNPDAELIQINGHKSSPLLRIVIDAKFYTTDLQESTILKTFDDVALRNGKGYRSYGLMICSESTKGVKEGKIKMPGKTESVFAIKLSKGNDDDFVRSIFATNEEIYLSDLMEDYLMRKNVQKVKAMLSQIIKEYSATLKRENQKEGFTSKDESFAIDNLRGQGRESRWEALLCEDWHSTQRINKSFIRLSHRGPTLPTIQQDQIRIVDDKQIPIEQNKIRVDDKQIPKQQNKLRIGDDKQNVPKSILLIEKDQASNSSDDESWCSVESGESAESEISTEIQAVDAEKYEMKFGPLHTQLNIAPPCEFEQLDFETRVDSLASSMIAAPDMMQQICEHYGIKYSQVTGKLDRRTNLGKAIDNRMRDFQNNLEHQQLQSASTRASTADQNVFSLTDAMCKLEADSQIAKKPQLVKAQIPITSDDTVDFTSLSSIILHYSSQMTPQQLEALNDAFEDQSSSSCPLKISSRGHPDMRFKLNKIIFKGVQF